MKLTLLSLLFFTVSIQSIAQKPITGVLKYRQIIMPKDTNNYIVRHYNLFFNDKESIIKIESTQRIGADTSVKLIKVNPVGKTEIYKNFETRKIFSEEIAFLDKIILRDTIASIAWKISKDRKQVGKFDCQKAEANVRGRNYTVWFTPEIPISDGPWKLHGLPGLILEASDTDKEVKFEFVSLIIPAPNDVIIEVMKPIGKKQTLALDEYLTLKESNQENFIKMIRSDPKTEGVDVKIDTKGIEIFSKN